MAYPTDSININRGSLLPKQLSDQVWAKAVEESAVMQLARRIELPGRGVEIPVVTADPEAAICCTQSLLI